MKIKMLIVIILAVAISILVLFGAFKKYGPDTNKTTNSHSTVEFLQNKKSSIDSKMVKKNVPNFQNVAWITGNAKPTIKNMIGWVEFYNGAEKYAYGIDGVLEKIDYTNFMSDGIMGASIPSVNAFFEIDGFALIYDENKSKWYWVELTDPETEMGENGYAVLDKGILASPEERIMGDGWRLCSGQMIYLNWDRFQMYAEGSDSSSKLIHSDPVHYAIKKRPFFTTPSTSVDDPEFQILDRKYKHINHAVELKRVYFKIIKTEGDWLFVVPTDVKIGVWLVGAYDDLHERVLLKWNENEAGWIKWRESGPVKNSHSILVGIDSFIGC